MAYHHHHHPHTDYNHPYANYSPAYVDQRSATPHSANVTNGERGSVPQSPSSFIYNRTNAPYPSQPGVFPNDDGGHTAYPQPYPHPHHHPHHPHPHPHAEPATYRHHHPHPQDRPHHHPDDQAHPSSQHVYIPPAHPKREYPPTPPLTRTQPQPDSSSSSSSPYASMTDVPPPAPSSSSSQQSHAMLSEADDRLMRCHFPLDSQAHLRRALFHVLNAPWKRANDREPTDETLLQFTTRNGKLYQCSFAKADGRCVKEFDRKDRVLDHIRTHIDLQPFVCRDAGCYQRFCSKPDLLQHEKNKEKTQCDQCGAKILPKNLARHKATNLCRAGRVDAFPPHLTTFR
ncbi:hypothetical protein M408DRAFT_328752 [Serendipita vermifera MAFF 305830]|uniref:C2H2-type domain-containing protein n=1 Tax=Serendipita vermifera MAFF 305830 TaxID=933852 RepID=A0A0C3BDH8_SERVB|nr:hypothetical protein M408DRAFT_328752 [Serendipita vermifera MAFF 305830]